MTFRVEIVCDVQLAKPGDAEGGCHSLMGGRSSERPVADADNIAQAKNAATSRAGDLGWVNQRRSQRPSRWVCPACKWKIG